MIAAKTPRIMKTEVPENMRGTYSFNLRHCGYLDTGCGVVASPSQTEAIAINCTSSKSHIGLSTPVRDLISHSLSENTKRGYAADLAHYAATGRTIPSSPEAVAEYLAESVGGSAVATIRRRLAAIAKAHRAVGADDPTKSEVVEAAMRGIRRTLGMAQRQAQAVLRDDLFTVLDRLGDRPKDIRDRAMLLLGFALAARRSELAALDVEDVEFTAKGALVTIRRSKTDQDVNRLAKLTPDRRPILTPS